MKTTEIVVIGAGIAGITAAIYLKRSNVDFVILEGDKIGGLLNTLKSVENYPAMPNSNGQEIISSLSRQMFELGIKTTSGYVQTILKDSDGFEVKTEFDIYKCKAVIVATGLSQNKQTIPGEEKYIGMGVSYCATCDGNFFKNQDVAVIGNNDIALEESLYLTNLVSKIYLINPDKQLNGNLEIIKQLSNSNKVAILNNKKVESIDGDDFGITSIKVDGKSIPVSGVFPYIGKKTSTQILNNLKPDMNGIYVKTDEINQSNIPGLFIAGDLRDKKLRQLVTAASDGAISATVAFQYIKGVSK